MSVGEELFADLPDFELGEETEHKELESVRATLQLYAILQQSRKNPVAMFPTSSGNTGSFGNACRLYVAASNGEGAPGVKRRLSSIEAATDFTGAMVGVRSLVRLIRTAKVKTPIQLDFGQFASDLFEIQFEDTRGDVFMRWARDCYKANPNQDGQDAKAERS
jgi:CRISPR system Cascade subunit CasB